LGDRGWGLFPSADAADLFASVGEAHTARKGSLNIGFGAVAAASCGLIHKATKIFQEGKKG
jgi:hypothetical protein